MTLNTCWASSLESTTTTGTGDANAIFDAATNNEWHDTYATANAAAGNQVSRFPEKLTFDLYPLGFQIMGRILSSSSMGLSPTRIESIGYPPFTHLFEFSKMGKMVLLKNAEMVPSYFCNLKI